MSTSLRDQLVQAGLISQKQARDVERQRQQPARPPRKDPPPPKHARGAPGPARPPQSSDPAKTARDQALNRRQHESAQRKALSAQIKQLIDQNRVAAVEGDEYYNFVDGTKIRRIAVNAAIRSAIGRGELVVVRHLGRHAVVPAAIAARIRERDAGAVIAATAQGAATDEGYAGFAVPDDLMW